MKYKLIRNPDIDEGIIDTIFRNRDVENYEDFLNVNEDQCGEFKDLNNISKAVDTLMNHISNGSRIFIQVDSDCDGYTSSAILLNYLKQAFPSADICWRLQDGKEHGIKLSDIPNDVDLVIIPDAGSNQYDEHKALSDKNTDVIVLDHHETEKESKYATVVNNQLSQNYKNKNLSGAGITYKFCQAIDSVLKTDNADFYLDLVAIGNIGDMMDLKEPETRYYVKKGLQKINNPLLRELIIKQDFSMKSVVNIHNIAFFIVPLINATIRTGTAEEKENMMKAFLGVQENIYYKMKGVYETLQENVARCSGNIRARQNKIRDKGVEKIEEVIRKEDLLKNKIIIINVTDFLEKNLTGLVANNISKKYKRPVLLLREKEENNEIYGGSGRGFEKGVIKNFREFLLETDLFELCEGHANAFGVEIKRSSIEKMKGVVNEKLKNNEIDQVEIYEIDAEYMHENINQIDIITIADYKNEWGSTLPEPLVAFTSIPFGINDISLIGKKKNVLKLINKNIEFVKFYFKKDEFDETFTDGETFYMNIVGRCSVNKWGSKTVGQVEIVDYEITEKLYF